MNSLAVTSLMQFVSRYCLQSVLVVEGNSWERSSVARLRLSTVLRFAPAGDAVVRGTAGATVVSAAAPRQRGDQVRYCFLLQGTMCISCAQNMH